MYYDEDYISHDYNFKFTTDKFEHLNEHMKFGLSTQTEVERCYNNVYRTTNRKDIYSRSSEYESRQSMKWI